MAVDVWSSNLKVVISAHTSKSVYLSRTGRRTEFAGWAVMVEALPLRAAVPLTNQPTTNQPSHPTYQPEHIIGALLSVVIQGIARGQGSQSDKARRA